MARGGANPLKDPKREQPGGEKDRGPEGDSAQRRMAAAYQGAVESVFAFLLPSLLGWWIDGKLGTSPAFLLIGLVLGFAAFFIRLWRMRDLMSGPRGEGPGPPESS